MVVRIMAVVNPGLILLRALSLEETHDWYYLVARSQRQDSPETQDKAKQARKKNDEIILNDIVLCSLISGYPKCHQRDEWHVATDGNRNRDS